MPKTKVKPRKSKLKQLPMEQFLQLKTKNENLKVGAQRGNRIIVPEAEAVEVNGSPNQLNDLAALTTSDDIVNSTADELPHAPVEESPANAVATDLEGIPVNVERGAATEIVTLSVDIPEQNVDAGMVVGRTTSHNAVIPTLPVGNPPIVVTGGPSVNITGNGLETGTPAAEGAGAAAMAEVAVHGGNPDPAASRTIVTFTQTISVPLEIQAGTENGMQIKGTGTYTFDLNIQIQPAGLSNEVGAHKPTGGRATALALESISASAPSVIA